MENLKRIDGYIDVFSMLKEGSNQIFIKPDYQGLHFSFSYHGETYYFKSNLYGFSKREIDAYNELVAEELAYDFGLPCVDYDLAIYLGRKGNLSKDYKEKGIEYLKPESFFPERLYYYDSSLEKKPQIIRRHENPNEVRRYLLFENCLEHIWDGFEIKFPKERKQIAYLMKKMVLLYLFDVLTCQPDRHIDNWEITRKGKKFDIGPLFDNERILFTQGDHANLHLGDELEFYEGLWESIKRFQKNSSDEFSSILYDKLWIIGRNNLLSIFERIEEKTHYLMPDDEKTYYLKSYQSHKERLESTLK